MPKKQFGRSDPVASPTAEELAAVAAFNGSFPKPEETQGNWVPPPGTIPRPPGIGDWARRTKNTEAAYLSYVLRVPRPALDTTLGLKKRGNPAIATKNTDTSKTLPNANDAQTLEGPPNGIWTLSDTPYATQTLIDTETETQALACTPHGAQTLTGSTPIAEVAPQECTPIDSTPFPVVVLQVQVDPARTGNPKRQAIADIMGWEEGLGVPEDARTSASKMKEMGDVPFWDLYNKVQAEHLQKIGHDLITLD